MVTGFEPEERLPDPRRARYLHRGAMFGVAAGAEALRSAGLPDGAYEPSDCGLAVGGSVDRPELQEFSDIFYTRQVSDGHELYRAPPSRTLTVSQNVAGAELARLARATGPMIGISTACTASSHALGEAYRRIQDGDARMMLAGRLRRADQLGGRDRVLAARGPDQGLQR